MDRAAAIPRSPLQLSVDAEVISLFRWWADHMVDSSDGGFYGEVDLNEKPVAGAAKGVILNTRLLWYFSEMALTYPAPDRIGIEAATLAKRAFEYLTAHFVDAEHGGLYWLLDAKGRALDTKKQGYAQAFGIYASSAYYRLTGDVRAFNLAHQLLKLLETRFWDGMRGGYIEATARDGSVAADQRLSDKDSDCPKTMNTHLHILEAYTGLHQAAPDAVSESALRRTISVFLEHFVTEVGHLNLFFDMDWGNQTHAVSFGHDIEASWLLWEAAIALGDPMIMEAVRPIGLKLADLTLAEGMRPDGGLMYERGHDGHVDADGEWWGQAEAMVGFLNAYQVLPRTEYFEAVGRLMAYIVREHKVGPRSEWSWYPKSSGRADPYLAGQWKCPYHNGRALLELRHRLNHL